MANYSKLNKTQLIDLANEAGLEVTEDMNNDEIRLLLEEANGSREESAETNAEEEEVAPEVSNTKPTLENAKTEKLYMDDTELSEALKKEPTMPVYIPLDMGEPVWSTQPVIINGVQFNITKGAIVQCPQSVAEIVQYAIVKETNQEVAHLLQ